MAPGRRRFVAFLLTILLVFYVACCVVGLDAASYEYDSRPEPRFILPAAQVAGSLLSLVVAWRFNPPVPGAKPDGPQGNA